MCKVAFFDIFVAIVSLDLKFPGVPCKEKVISFGVGITCWRMLYGRANGPLQWFLSLRN